MVYICLNNRHFSQKPEIYKNGIFFINRNFYQKSKFWSQIKILLNNLNFRLKTKFQTNVKHFIYVSYGYGLFYRRFWGSIPKDTSIRDALSVARHDVLPLIFFFVTLVIFKGHKTDLPEGVQIQFYYQNAAFFLIFR